MIIYKKRIYKKVKNIDIEKMYEENGLRKIINITKLTDRLLYKMYKAETNKYIYAIKVLN